MSKQEHQVGYKFAILSEDVATQDLFEDKTHERVSENLFQIISDSSKGVTIGLEGSWGSGKSTVIKLLKDKLTKDVGEKNLFFMFDAWAHDGDPLRRIFLESLIRAIDPKDQDTDLQDIKKRITGRKKIVEVKAKKSTSRLGKLISFSALLIPLGFAFLGKVNYDKLVWPWASQAHGLSYLFLLGVTLCLSPLFVLAYWNFRGDKDPETKNITWEFFSIDSKEDYTQDITEDGERTSIEFEDHFQHIIQTSMGKGLIERSIVVIDNLDRVDPDHAKNIWSTLQTFFQKRSNGSVDLNWSDKLWFVIPFDRDGFIKIWSANGTNNETATSFLRKCFQLIAEVPQPVMSAWSEYVKKSIEEALAQWPEHERNAVYLTYVRYMSQLDSSPTPRDIKAFVNQVGLSGAMWGGQVSAEAICLYVLFKAAVSTNDFRKSLISGSLPNEYQTDADRTTIYAELAGLLFGVNQTKGLQLLLGPEINEAFKAGNGEALSKLVKDHGDAFWIAYEASKKQWMVGYTHTDDYKIEFTKAFHSGLIEHKNRLTRDVETMTRIWTDTFGKFDFAQFDYADSMGFILDLRLDQTSFLDALHQFTSNELQKIIDQIGKPEFSGTTLANFSLIIELLKSRNKPLARLQYSNLNTKNWQAWLDLLEEHSLSLETVLPKKGTIAELASDAQFSSVNLNMSAIDYLKKTYDIYPNSLEWESVTDQMVGWMKLPNRNFDCEPLYELITKFAVNGNNKISSKIIDCVNGAEFWAAGHSYVVTKNSVLPILAAMSVEEKIQVASYVPNSIKTFWSSTIDQENLNKFFNRLKDLGQHELPWTLCKDKRNSLAVQIIRNIGDEKLFESSVGVCFIDEYNWIEKSEVNLIAEKLAKNGAFQKNEKEMKGEPLLYQGVYKIFYGLNHPNICTFIDTEINQVNKEIWLECLKINGDLLDLVKDKNHYFSEALTEFFVDLVSGDIEIDDQLEFVPKIPNLFRKAADLDKVVVPKVLDAYVNAIKDHLNAAEFKEISPFFSSHLMGLNEKPLMERINSWIDEDEKERIQWLIEQKLKPFNEPLESLISRIKLGLQSTDLLKLEIAAMVNSSFNLGVVLETPSVTEEEEGTSEGAPISTQ
jgi:hypothetical protein